ncbi:hypothetical protein ACVWY3_001303 [Bradyrhizobium sp. USDA 4486]
MSLVGGDAGAQDRRDGGEIDRHRQLGGEGDRGDDIFGEAAVHAVAGVVLVLAQRLPAGLAIFASHARIVQPGDTDGIADPQTLHAGPERGDDAGSLMAGNEGRHRLHRPVAVGGVQVGVADAARFDLDQDLARTGLRHRHILDHQRLAELFDDGGFHGRHESAPLQELEQTSDAVRCALDWGQTAQLYAPQTYDDRGVMT